MKTDQLDCGLFDPAERDACGTGFVADIRGTRSHQILRDAITAVSNLEHRGAVSRDGRTSDGAGVLTQIPFDLIVADAGVNPTLTHEDLAVGMLFLPPERVCEARAVVERCIEASRLKLHAWREVPFRVDVLGADARTGRPAPWQVVLGRPDGADDSAFDRELYLVRRRVERLARLGYDPDS